MKSQVIEEMIRCKAIIFNDVKLKSGRTSPYFFNVAKMFNPHSLNVLGEAYAKTIAELVDLKEFEGLFGPSYKGIPLAVTTSLKIKQLYGEDKPIVYNRKELKEYGVKGDELFIGSLEKGSRLIIVDDVLTTGLTKLQVKGLLEDFGFKVIGVVVLLDRNELEDGVPASDIIKQHGLQYRAIVDAVELFQVIWLRRRELKIGEVIFGKLKEYYNSYGSKKLLFSVKNS
ncbi:MAG: orotate phosphoribosyltransferase [Nitrososphaerota archaeon]|nr:orotate phosphoribosyltransferase [Nitrososphaerota archaeon]